MKIYLKFLTCFVMIACASGGDADEVYTSSSNFDLPTNEFTIEKQNDSGRCSKRARQQALRINAAIDQTFPLFVPSTAEEGAAAFASFFAVDGVFQSPGGILNGRDAIFAGFLSYGQNPGEMNQHVITQNAYWDEKKSTLTVERTWISTLTADRVFGSTTLLAGTTYTQDDCVVIRFACDKHCECILPGKVVYYREYFDPAQFIANYTNEYPSPCHCIGER